MQRDGWKKRLIYWKFCVQRAFGYLNILQGFALMFLVCDKLKIGKYYWLLAIVLGILLVIAGYLEDKLGLSREEFELNCERMGLKK